MRCLLVAGPALAQTANDADRIESLAEQADFDDAEVAATHALSTGNLPPIAAARVYVVLGTIAAARGNSRDAKSFFRKALVLNPGLTLPPSAGPHVRASFSNARADLADDQMGPAPQVLLKQGAAPVPAVWVRPVPASVWIAGVATGGLAVATVALGVIALDRRAAFQQANADPQQSVDARSALRNSTLTIEHETTTVGGVMVLSAALTTILYLTRPGETKQLSVSAFLGTGGGTLLLAGHF
ncbi:MAG TPA: hypothetical protein VGY54_04735 [Polyangiaceae bacterium]|nr:hypothetical protein [Polyangiaceae bacterium]